jgi:hypothetical protein
MARTRTPEENRELAEAFTACLGRYVVCTSNVESQFMHALRLALADDTDATMAIWFQFQSTRARLELVRNTFRSAFPQTSYVTKLTGFIARFKGLTRQRNYLCHAGYSTDENGVVTIVGYQIIEDDYVVMADTTRNLTKGLCNEIRRSCDQLIELNDEVNKLIDELQEDLLKIGRIPKRLLEQSPLDP